ncbi:MAG: RNA polymerase sigma factor [Planctomycetes bacterium]|nr:RNA polymerase sigma factor [Planctomycetota bacterium]
MVEAAQSGDQAAFAQLYEKYREKIYRLSWRHTGDKEKALDLCQESFIKAFLALPRFRFNSTFYTWLFRIAYNTCMDAHRLEAAVASAEISVEQLDEAAWGQVYVGREPHPSSRAEERELREKVQEALLRLPEYQRSVFVLHALEELEYKEIARVLNCSLGTVMSRLYYARRRLRSLLEGYLATTQP